MPGGRVLMIAHHFPPMGGSGSNRALAFARYLAEYGWQPTVVTPGVSWAANRDDRLLAELPSSVRVIRTRSFEPRPRPAPAPRQPAAAPSGGVDGARASAGRGSRARSHLGHLKRFPDAHLGWLPFALAAASRLDYDVAYSSSGPFTSHLIGLMLKQRTRRPWVAELRDGWYRWNRAIFPDYPAWRDGLERRLEAATVRHADRVVLVTERMADAFRRQYARVPAEQFAVVSNGFDRAQLGLPSPPPPPDQDSRSFEVLHAGALYYGRSLASFLQAASRLVDADVAFASRFRLTLIGTLDATARAELASHRLGARISLVGQLGHADALRAMRRASLLLLIANTTPGAEATVPGKLFEYLAIGRPVLAVAPPESSTADVLALSGGGWVVAADDPDAIARGLQAAFAVETEHRWEQPASARLADFDRQVLAGRLAHIFDQVATGATGRA